MSEWRRSSFCAGNGECITVTESGQHPGILYIGTEKNGQPGRKQLTVTRAEWDAHVAGIAGAERERIRQLALEHSAHFDCDPAWGTPFADLIGNPS
jgi:hypothetical protein